MVWERSNFILLYLDVQFSQHHRWKDCPFFPHMYSLAPLLKISWPIHTHRFISGPLVLFRWSVYLSVKSENSSVMSDSLWPHGLYGPWNSTGQNTGVGSLSLLQGIFPTQGLNPGLSTLQADSLPAETQAQEYWNGYSIPSPGDLPDQEDPGSWTRVSCTAGRFFTNWAIREDLIITVLL